MVVVASQTVMTMVDMEEVLAPHLLTLISVHSRECR